MLLTIGVLIAVGIAMIQIKSVFYGEQDISKEEVVNQFARDIDSIIDKCSSTTGDASFDYKPSIKKYKLEIKDNVVFIQDKLTNKTAQFAKVNVKLKDTIVIDSKTIHISKIENNVFILGRCLEGGEECSSNFVCCNKYCWGDPIFICQEQCADNDVRAADDESCCSGFLNKTTGLCDVAPFCPSGRVCVGAPEAEIVGGEDCCPIYKPVCTGGHCCPSDKPKWCNSPTSGDSRCMNESEYDNDCESIGICSGPLPDHFDWRNVDGKNWMSPVKAQGSCGSCWAFAAVGSLEGTYNIEYGDSNINPDLSEQNLVSSCCSAGDCEGGWHNSAFMYIKGNGIVDESCFPYQSSNCISGRTCLCRCENGICSKPCYCELCSNPYMKIKLNDFYHIAGIDNIKRALVCHGPLAVALSMRVWNSGSYSCVPARADHAVVIVGYDDGGGYWIIRNSWGSNWNGDGHFKVKYGECHIEEYAWSVYNLSG